MRSSLALLSLLAACGPETNAITIELAPDVISSIDGTLSIHATAFAEREPAPGETIEVTIDYTDRHGTAHAIAPAQGTTDEAGAFDATLEGLTFDGTGTATARILVGTTPLMLDGAPVEASATFAVLDRTPPTVSITPPPSDTVRIGNDVTVEVHVTDEIGVSQVFFESGDGFNRDRGTVVASGSTDATVSFDFQVRDNAIVGSTITLYALAADLSGNQAAAEPVTLTVVP